MPCLHDRYEEGVTTKSECFWQDLLVAKRLVLTTITCSWPFQFRDSKDFILDSLRVINLYALSFQIELCIP